MRYHLGTTAKSGALLAPLGINLLCKLTPSPPPLLLHNVRIAFVEDARPYKKESKNFCFLRLPFVLARFEVQYKETICLSRLYPCRTAMPGRSRRESPGAFLGHFLPRSKKCHPKPKQRARAVGAVWASKKIKNFPACGKFHVRAIGSAKTSSLRVKSCRNGKSIIISFIYLSGIRQVLRSNRRFDKGVQPLS